MARFLFLVLILAGIIGGFMNRENLPTKVSNKTSYTAISEQNKRQNSAQNTNNIQKSNTYTAKISANSVRQYFKQKNIRYSSYGKKIVFYDASSSSCPYAAQFNKEMQSIISSGSYSMKYDFKILPEMGTISSVSDADYEKMKKYNIPTNGLLPESIAKPILDFHKACGLFCIIDSDYNMIYSTSALGMNDIRLLRNTLNNL